MPSNLLFHVNDKVFKMRNLTNVPNYDGKRLSTMILLVKNMALKVET